MTDRLRDLAELYGISTEFRDWKGQQRHISDEIICAVLAAFDVDTSSEDAIEAAYQAKIEQPWRQMIEATTVAIEGSEWIVHMHVDHGADAHMRVHTEAGRVIDLVQVDNFNPPRMVGNRLVGEASFRIPPDVEAGYHTIEAISQSVSCHGHLIVAPQRLDVERYHRGRCWGYAAQLYSVRSAHSWGIGDFADLADLLTWSSGQQGADYLLINPLHAAQPTVPMDDSPYLPSSRFFLNPIYIRPENIEEYRLLDSDVRADIEKIRQTTLSDFIDRDQFWTAKKKVLEVIFSQGRRPIRQIAFESFCSRQGQRLDDFATWSYLCENYGNDWKSWPAHYRDVNCDEVAQIRRDHSARIDFFRWLQWIAYEQLSSAQQAARDSGMNDGIVTDLAVGVSGSSADTWTMNSLYASNIHVGAPPDAYNQMGQDWGQPPWRPDRLAQCGYEPLRAMIRSALRGAGGIRIDHILGMFRLWWIPDGRPPSEGTYVRCDHHALISLIVLEAQRCGAFVVGEDLGTVEEWVHDYLVERGILGTSVMWFEYEDSHPRTPQRWRKEVMASVVTHDLPPTCGYIEGEHVNLRGTLGLLSESIEDETAAFKDDMESWKATLIAHGVLEEGEHSTEQIMMAAYRYLLLSKAMMINVALVDAVADRRIQNQPGTWKEYPNWKVPLSDASRDEIMLEDLITHPCAIELGQMMKKNLN